MANEILLTGMLVYGPDSNGAMDFMQALGLYATVATKKYIKAPQTIGLTEEAIVLGEITSPGWAMFINRDPTNFIELRVGTGGAKFAKLLPGKPCGPIFLGSGAQAPYAIADTAPALLEYLIVSQ